MTKTGDGTNIRIYADMIERGDVIVCEYLAREIENLIRDLENPMFIYDTKDAERRFAFQEKFCLQSKAPYYMTPVQLMPWQKAFFESLYSFHFADSGKRRFTESLLLVARKNGKSTMLAADGNTDLFIGAGGTSIVCASNDDRQAKLIWREIAGMRGRLDPKKRITGQNLTEIVNRLKNIEIFRLSSKTQNKDGFNIDKSYIDESHDMQDDEITQAVWRGMSSKDEPLFINCTTQGFINDGYLDKKIDYCRKVIDGEIDDLQILPFLYEQDNESEIWQDSASWEKSNPAIRYGIKKTDKLKRDLEVARHDNGAKIHMLCKDFNIKQNTAAAWLSNDDFCYLQNPASLDDFRGAFALAAVDLSETTDLTNAKILLMRQGDPTKYVFSHYWIPAGKLEKSDDSSAGAEYRNWARDGYLTICDGFDNNLIEVADYLANLKKLYDIKILKCGYDQRFAREFLERCEMYGIETERILQTPDVMSNPARLVESELKAHLINYGNNPVDRWCLSNAALKVDNLGRIMVVKINGQHSKRIDGAITLIILYATLQRYKTEYYNLMK